MSNPVPALQLTPAQDADAPALAELRVAAMRESLLRVGRFDPQRARQRLLDGFVAAHTWHVGWAGERFGCVVLRREADHLRLAHLYIHPQHQGRGVGAAVLAWVFAEAEAAGLPVRVGALRESDSNRFYARHGFVLVAQAEFDNEYLRVPAC
ncbi:GNAT family N-acetyltransferase [Roseateles sp. LKC17W]|uniref:GNAT family N-acetyltransferase n=1 Tax=Pelomonas margarita TaxID=3299031 RepID=A0ABW7FDZ8_9BURK